MVMPFVLEAEIAFSGYFSSLPVGVFGGFYVLVKRGTSIYMDSEILNWIDEKVDERIFASRSHAFEYAIRQLMKNCMLNKRGY